MKHQNQLKLGTPISRGGSQLQLASATPYVMLLKIAVLTKFHLPPSLQSIA